MGTRYHGMRTPHHDSLQGRTTSSSCLLALMMLMASQTFIWVNGGGLKVINNPGGGQVAYGSIDQQNTPQGAMGAMLQARPKAPTEASPWSAAPFKYGTPGSYAAFFTLIAKDQGHTRLWWVRSLSLSPRAAKARRRHFLPTAPNTSPLLCPSRMRELADAWHASQPCRTCRTCRHAGLPGPPAAAPPGDRRRP